MNIKNLFNSKKPSDDVAIVVDDKHQISSQKNEDESHLGESTDIDLKLEPTGDKARDLMILVGKAIDCWAKMYDLEDLPKHIIFKQALGIMNAWNNIYKPKDKP